MQPIAPRQIQRIFIGQVFNVLIERIVTEKGRTIDVEVVRHPPSVVILPITDRGNIILVRQYRHAIGRSAWELPAGSVDRDEEPEKAAERECHEEIGMIPGQLQPLGAYYPTPGYCDELMHFFVATQLRQPTGADEPAHQDEDEEIETREFSVSELQQMIESGEIIDLKTVAGLARMRQR